MPEKEAYFCKKRHYYSSKHQLKPKSSKKLLVSDRHNLDQTIVKHFEIYQDLDSIKIRINVQSKNN